MDRLEAEFSRTKYLCTGRREELAGQLGMSQNQVSPAGGRAELDQETRKPPLPPWDRGRGEGKLNQAPRACSVEAVIHVTKYQ